ncbi:MAG: hypothetical protein OXF05_01310 [Hyphomicrobiales bacterium]|nr:hypothetical protein [Hyphomicrobiales bacterium]
MVRKNNRKPALYFTRGTLEGFTSAGVQGFNELNPAAIVRELLQNSLDAVREDERSKAVVRFKLESMPLTDVPGIDNYKDALKKAVKYQKEFQGDHLPDQAKIVVDAIENCLKGKNVDVLFVLDNGLGLDERRMTGLLADGLSVKSSAGAGAVGNGHLTAIPASDLRYVLYGGVSDNGKKIASGHAILASFFEKDDLMGKDGYYALAVGKSKSKLFDFPSQNQIAPLIKNKLDWIEKNSESKRGAVVIIPGFNKFREMEGNLWDVIKKAAACSFFAAIADEHLEVIYQDDEGERKLDKSNIGAIFESDIAYEKRAKNFLSGNRAADAYKTAVMGKKHIVDVGCGEAEVVIREVNEGKSRIDLCRNGMWITARLPRLQNKFNDRKPFHCLIKVSATDGDIHRLIRKSEGPLHNHIEARKWLEADEQRLLEEAFGRISEFLSENLEELQDEEFAIDDFLNVTGLSGKWEELPHRQPRTPSIIGNGNSGGGNGGGGGGGDRNINAFKRGGSSVPFGAVPVPTGPRSYSFELHPQKELKEDIEAEIRFILDENIDETCDLTNEEQFVKLKDIFLDGKKVSGRHLIKQDGGKAVLGVRLGQFNPGEKRTIRFNYDLPDGVTVRKKDKIVLRAEIVRRRNQL